MKARSGHWPWYPDTSKNHDQGIWSCTLIHLRNMTRASEPVPCCLCYPGSRLLTSVLWCFQWHGQGSLTLTMGSPISHMECLDPVQALQQAGRMNNAVLAIIFVLFWDNGGLFSISFRTFLNCFEIRIPTFGVFQKILDYITIFSCFFF